MFLGALERPRSLFCNAPKNIKIRQVFVKLQHETSPSHTAGRPPETCLTVRAVFEHPVHFLYMFVKWFRRGDYGFLERSVHL